MPHTFFVNFSWFWSWKYVLSCFMYETLLVDCDREKIGSGDLDGFTCFRVEADKNCTYKLTFQSFNTFFTDWLLGYSV
jgi:hypothetical protein